MDVNRGETALAEVFFKDELNQI